MQRLFLCLFVVWVGFSSVTAFADVSVRGYFRSNGTYVRPHYRTYPNHTVRDNYSFHGNINPHTGKSGENRYLHDRTSPYYAGPDRHGRVGHGNVYSPREIPILSTPREVPLCVVTANGCR
jgi:hypothetical protein